MGNGIEHVQLYGLGLRYPRDLVAKKTVEVAPRDMFSTANYLPFATSHDLVCNKPVTATRCAE